MLTNLSLYGALWSVNHLFTMMLLQHDEEAYTIVVVVVVAGHIPASIIFFSTKAALLKSKRREPVPRERERESLINGIQRFLVA